MFLVFVTQSGSFSQEDDRMALQVTHVHLSAAFCQETASLFLHVDSLILLNKSVIFLPVDFGWKIVLCYISF